uniref:TPX2 C-terminal domain-containing protein n=1 Tax=Salix viminalis TaxID=40686 RepID=A0A6N2KZH1_SALVM
MDSDNHLLPDGGLEAAHQNGGHQQSPDAGEDCVVSNNLNGSAGDTFKLGDGTTDNLSTGELEDELKAYVGSNGLSVSKEGELKVKGADDSENAKSQRAPGKRGAAKPSHPKKVSVTQVKKGKDARDAGVQPTVPNGSVAVNSQIKQHLKSKSFNERQGQHPRSPTVEDAKPRKVGALPNYGFSFKCDERAEKRKEFYSKLEEKIHAIEMEKTTLQAKSKIPTTRAKSPKLGRKKSSSPADTEGNNSQSYRPGRLSLDEKVSSNIPIKGLSPAHPKKPQRKSLPKLPSEKTKLSSTNDEKTKLPKASNEENPTSSNQSNEGASSTQEQEAVSKNEESEFAPQKDEIVVKEEAQATLAKDPVALVV